MVILLPLALITLIPLIFKAAIAVGLSYVVTLATTKKPKTPFDNHLQTLAQRGSIIEDVVGRVRKGYVFGWAGNRTSGSVNRSSGKGGGLFGSGQGTTSWYESGWHQIAVGPVDALYKIYINGAIVFETTLLRANVASGTTHSTNNNTGTFTIYWGECNQPVNTSLAQYATDPDGNHLPASRWPRLFYIEWHQYELGATPVWPTIEYEFEKFMDTPSHPLATSESYFNPSAAELVDQGPNPAWAVWKFLTGGFPDGAGIDPGFWNLPSADWLAFANQMQSDHIPCNFVLSQGMDYNEAIANILADVGAFLVQRGDQLIPVMIRPITSAVPQITADFLTDPDPEIERIQGGYSVDRVQFFIKDRTIKFNDMPLTINNSGIARLYGRPKAQRVDLVTINDRVTGWKVAERRFLEVIDRYSYKFKGLRGMRRFYPGMAFNLAGVGLIRINAMAPSFDDSSTSFDCLLDLYSLASTGYIPGGGTDGSGIPDFEDVGPDYFDYPFIIPANHAPRGNAVYIGIARIRDTTDVIGAAVYGSTTSDGNYVLMGDQDLSGGGGTLNAPIFATQTSPIVVGPTFTAWIASDVGGTNSFIDLTGNDAAWEAGDQICIINDECFYFQSVTAVTGGWQINNMIRAMDGTVASDHGIGSKVVLFVASRITPMTSSQVTPGGVTWIKVVPYSQDGSADISAMTPMEITVDPNSLATLALTAPIGNESIEAGSVFNITWAAPDLAGTITIHLSGDNGATYPNLVVANTPNNGQYAWTTPNLNTLHCRIRLTSDSTPSITSSSNYNFTIYNGDGLPT